MFVMVSYDVPARRTEIYRKMLKEFLVHEQASVFMGDLPEPKYHTSMAETRDTTPVMTKIYSTLGRRFNKKDIEEAIRMGDEMVSRDILKEVCS